ncbi:hypothetical protein Q31b_32930 [Novipirellula aureliae]|uniref:Uncharacterized protein n=1 Tax=Novipirellula aureliae TaxID=2527966 RepID=A0A5C6DVJ6_9BACT|nr:hypothetical protein [Novipirellula aureliae]TWU39977.1 hypothetical protein Q31b_32930 [Novipirellula aureliae]
MRTRRPSLILPTVLFVWVLGPTSMAAEGPSEVIPSKPNFVIIFTDDMG